CTLHSALQELKAWPLRIGARRQARQARRVISLGGKLTDLAVECLGVPRDRIEVIPNGVDPGYFATALAAPRDPKLLLFVGRLFENKGVGDLIEATRGLTRDFRLAIVGDGPLRESLSREAADSRIKFLGSVTEEELRDLYGRAAALVLPSHADGMPTVILEAF